VGRRSFMLAGWVYTGKEDIFMRTKDKMKRLTQIFFTS
jgi:hypothetical protein